MALIRDLTPVTSDRTSIHGEADCGYRTFSTRDRGRIVQLDTYGSDDRKLAGKASQSIQLDESHARQLVEIIARAFPGVLDDV